MSNRYYTSNPDRKVMDGRVASKPKAGSAGKVTVKQAFTNGKLPGKASNWYGKKGPVVSGYASSKGLC